MSSAYRCISSRARSSCSSRCSSSIFLRSASYFCSAFHTFSTLRRVWGCQLFFKFCRAGKRGHWDRYQGSPRGSPRRWPREGPARQPGQRDALVPTSRRPVGPGERPQAPANPRLPGPVPAGRQPERRPAPAAPGEPRGAPGPSRPLRAPLAPPGPAAPHQVASPHRCRLLRRYRAWMCVITARGRRCVVTSGAALRGTGEMAGEGGAGAVRYGGLKKNRGKTTQNKQEQNNPKVFNALAGQSEVKETAERRGAAGTPCPCGRGAPVPRCSGERGVFLPPPAAVTPGVSLSGGSSRAVTQRAVPGGRGVPGGVRTADLPVPSAARCPRAIAARRTPRPPAAPRPGRSSGAEPPPAGPGVASSSPGGGV